MDFKLPCFIVLWLFTVEDKDIENTLTDFILFNPVYIR